MSLNSALTAMRRDIDRVKLNISNKAQRSSHAAVRVMRSETRKIADLASRYAPFKTGLLDGSTGATPSFQIIERAGVRGRKEFNIELNMRKWKTVRGRRVSLSQYAGAMHSGDLGYKFGYSLGKGSVAKAQALGLATSPNSSGKFVGLLFLSRAANQRRGAIEYGLQRAVREALT